MTKPDKLLVDETLTVCDKVLHTLTVVDIVDIIVAEILDEALIVGALALGLIDDAKDADDDTDGVIVDFELAEEDVETVAVGVGIVMVTGARLFTRIRPNCVSYIISPVDANKSSTVIYDMRS